MQAHLPLRIGLFQLYFDQHYQDAFDGNIYFREKDAFPGRLIPSYKYPAFSQQPLGSLQLQAVSYYLYCPLFVLFILCLIYFYGNNLQSI